MTRPCRWAGLTALAAVAACADSESSGARQWRDDALPRLIVAISARADSAVVRDTVRAVPAPEITFAALSEPDPNHIVAVTWQGDTVGLLEELGYRLAVGSVSDEEARFIHRGDPAWVSFPEVPGRSRPGRVEWVRGPQVPNRYSADVAIEYREAEGVAVGSRFSTVTVRPTGPQDSVAAVPAGAVVRLPLGDAVFVPVGPGLYEARWVVVWPGEASVVSVRAGLGPGTVVVVSGLTALAAARDSLSQSVRAP